MFNKKPLILGLASALLATGLAACGGGGAAGDSDLTYWCPSVDTNVMAQLAEDFKVAHPEYADKKIDLNGNFGEDKAYAELHKNVDIAADVILMADDNIREAVNAEELTDLSALKGEFSKTVDAKAIAACSVGNSLYGLAYRADNSPMPIYSAEVFAGQESKLNSLEGMLEVCKNAGKKFYLDIGNGWYNAFLLWAGGAQFTAGKDSAGKDVLWNDVMEHQQDVAEVLKAVKALFNQYNGTWVSSSDAAIIQSSFQAGECGVAFNWNNVSNIKGVSAGQTIKVAEWPTLNAGNATIKLKCFQSYKAVVVKDMEDGDRKDLAIAFANYLASKAAQEKRISLEYGPSNLELLNSDKMNSLDFAKAIKNMDAEGRTVSQAVNVTGKFWSGMEAFGGVLTNGIADGEAKAWGNKPNAAAFVAGAVGNAGWEQHSFN